MRRVLPLIMLVALVARGEAQPAEAMGQPLPDAKLMDGTVMLRVIAGDPTKPMAGLEAAIMITPPDGLSDTMVRRARTDTDGRVTFSDVPPEAMVQLKAPSEASDTGEVTSSQFPMPAAGGVRVMISTLPVRSMAPAGPPVPGVAGGGAKGPAEGMPTTPRAMSGQARAEDNDPGDRVTVRLSYDDFTDKHPPKDQPVLLVGYRFDLHVEGSVVKSDADGRAAFNGLDKRGATTYFALTLLPRGTGVDRLISAPVMMPGDHGVRVILSGDKRDAPMAIDDLGKIDPQPPGGVPAGEVHVWMAGLVEPGDRVELLDALTGKVVATSKVGPPLPNADSLTATWDGTDEAALAVGALAVVIDANATRAGNAKVEVRRRTPTPAPPTPAPPSPASPSPASPSPAPPSPASPSPASPTPASWVAATDANGEAKLTNLPVGVELDVFVTVEGMTVPVRTVTLPAKGGRHEMARVVWQPKGQGAARFAGVAGGPEKAYLVRGFLRGQPCLSAPFQLTATRGAATTVLIFPRILFGFSLRASIHDLYLGARGTFTLRNSSLAPFIPGTIGKPEELVIPLPRGFIGADVEKQFAEQVGIDKTRGFIIREPVPPGGMGFVGHFSLKTYGGHVTWDMDLPFGTLESGMEIKRTAKMELELPPRMAVREAVDERGSWYVLSPISVQPRQRMIFSASGLPEEEAWTLWSRNIVGLAVLLVLAGTLAMVLLWPAPAREVVRSRYDQLLDELAALGDATDGNTLRARERLLVELETLHRARVGEAG